jgi:hypothetical protein
LVDGDADLVGVENGDGLRRARRVTERLGGYPPPLFIDASSVDARCGAVAVRSAHAAATIKVSASATCRRKTLGEEKGASRNI